jgi:menaquinol-cytochrome c reductase iron-sulfur subunit
MAWNITRRKFTAGLIGVNGLLGALVATPVVVYVFAPWGLQQPEYVWRRLAPIDEIPIDEPTAFHVTFPESGSGISIERPAACYVVRTGTTLYTFNNLCTHMGCPTRWNALDQVFQCPCHGGLYSMLGQVIGGPPPYALRQFARKIVRENGRDVIYIRPNILD